jgi:hypothetical protein
MASEFAVVNEGSANPAFTMPQLRDFLWFLDSAPMPAYVNKAIWTIWLTNSHCRAPRSPVATPAIYVSSSYLSRRFGIAVSV